MKFQTISIRLKQALEEIGDEISTNEDVLMQIFDLEKQKYPKLDSLLDALRAHPALDVFNGKMHRVANRGMQVEIDNLAKWLIRRASIVGSTRAIAGLEKYFGLSEIPFSMAVGLTGIRAPLKTTDNSVGFWHKSPPRRMAHGHTWSTWLL